MERQPRLIAAVLIALLLLVSPVAGCSQDEKTPAPATEESPDAQESEPPVEQPSGEEVVAGACSQCHDASRIFVQAYGTDWSAIVDEMNTAHGAALTDAEKKAVVEFLGNRELSMGEEVVATKCGTCHDAQRIYEQGDAADWAAIVQQMTEVHGAVLTDAEKAAAVEFLEGL